MKKIKKEVKEIPLTSEEIRGIYELDISLSDYVKQIPERSIYDEPITGETTT